MLLGRWVPFVVEIMEQADRLTGAHGGAALEQRFVVARERRDGEARAVHHGHALLRAIAVSADLLDFAAQQSVVDRGGEHALSGASHAFGIDRAAPA
jgi:hypothetical protein